MQGGSNTSSFSNSSAAIPVPEGLKGIVTEKEGNFDAVSTSIECGTVEDIRVEVPNDLFNDLGQQVLDSRSASIQEKIAQGIPKLPAKAISIDEKNGEVVLTITSDDKKPVDITLSIPKPLVEIHRGLGGGAFNTTVDSAIINLALYRALGLPEEQVVKSYLYLTLSEDQIESVHKQAKPFPNLEILWVEGSPRRSVFIKNKETGEEIYFSTPYGEVNSNRQIPTIQTPRFLLLHNQPDERIFWDVAVRVRNDLVDHSIVWSVGSNQIRDGIDRYASPIGVCETMTLNLGEALAWIRKSNSTYIRNDDVLLQFLETYDDGNKKTRFGIGGSSFVRIFGIFKTELDEPEKSLVLPENPIKRRIVAQRLADILHKFGVSESVFITDGSNPTIASFKYKDRKEQIKKKVQYYIPIIEQERGEKIDRLLEESGCDLHHKDATGCGDSYTATVLALKQITGNRVHPTTISIVANHIARLVYAMPHSNLMEIEGACPGITEKVLRMALKDLDEINAQCKKNNRLETLESEAHSLIFQALK